MRKVMENQLSWFAILMTAFYSLLASCRGEGCGHEELQRCARPLQKMSSTASDFVTTKEELELLCPDLEAGMGCIDRYTMRCMDDRQRQHFSALYSGTHIAVMELCQDGPYQEKFLKHAPCMQKVKPQFDLCSKKYTATMQSIANGDQSNHVKSICCSFQEYLDCSHHTVMRKCGTEAAKFTKEFLDRMSTSLIKMHCQAYSQGECGPVEIGNTASGTMNFGGVIVPLLLLAVGKYLF